MQGTPRAPQDFATNFAAVAMPPDNPAKITKLSDLAEPVVKVAVCQPQVPCGKVAAEVFQNAGITVTPVTEEVDVKSTLAKVTLGEADAAMVYVTDVHRPGRQGVEHRDPRRRRTPPPPTRSRR